MKLSTGLEAAFNTQMKNEYLSSFLYMNMEAYFADLGLDGFAAWFKAQAAEEASHGRKFFEFIVAANNRAVMLPVEATQRNFDGPLELFKFALQHEKEVTAAIHNLYQIACDEKAYFAKPFLLKFIEEQQEEEDMFQSVFDRMKIATGNAAAILDMDRELGARTT